jgi:hypothetical protein
MTDMIRLRGKLALLLVFISGTNACGRETLPSGFTVADSAGVSVAVSTEALWEATPSEAWHIGPEPMLDLARAGNGPEYEFFRVKDATRSADGRIVVANSGSSEIRVYSPDGVSLGAAGRDGDGPGEYRQIRSVDLIGGDSLIVYSWPTRVTVLAPSLAFARSFDLTDYASGIYPLEPGLLLAAMMFPSVDEYEGPGGVIRAPVPLARLTTLGQLQDTVVVAAGGEEYMEPSGESFSSGRVIFGKLLALDTGPGTIVTGSAERMEFTVFAPEGTPRLVVRVPAFPLDITKDDIDEEHAEWLGPEPSSRRREIVEGMPVSARKPAYTTLLVDSDMNFWAGEAQGLAAFLHQPRGWNVFRSDGRWLGSLTTPVGFTVFEVGSDYILGVQTDSLDVEHVQLLPIEKDETHF